MATYPLARLIGLRRHRQDDASRLKSLAQKKLEQSKNAVITKKKEIEEYKIWKEEEIVRRYDAIMFKQMTSEGFESFKQGIANLEFGLLKLMEELEECKKDVDTKKNNLLQAEAELKEAIAALNKLEEHRNMWIESQRIEHERAEEKELEDFKVKKNVI